MKKLLWYVKKHISEMTLGDMAALNVCICSIGVILGICVPKKGKKAVAALAGLSFILTYVPLISRFLEGIFPLKKRLITGNQIEVFGNSEE